MLSALFKRRWFRVYFLVGLVVTIITYVMIIMMCSALNGAVDTSDHVLGGIVALLSGVAWPVSVAMWLYGAAKRKMLRDSKRP
jgi:hypothetical protein